MKIPFVWFCAGALSAMAHPGHENTATVATTPVPSEVSITLEGTARVIRANGIPDHATGDFPVRGNPNRIAPQRYEFRMPAAPSRAAQPTAVNMNLFGVAVNGVIFDAGANEWWRDGAAEEVRTAHSSPSQ